jgi:glyoxylase-like metal-dependent hydrolase (beta-lactamase superfamily II)
MMHMLVLFLTFFLSISTAHAAAKKKPAGKGKIVEPTLNIQSITSSDDTFNVNSFLLETRNSVILIDTQLTTLEAMKVKEAVKKTGKPLAAIFITHPHPDHYNNIELFLSLNPQAPVYATAAIIKAIQDDDPLHRRYWSRFYPGKYPTKLVLPASVVKAGDSLIIDTLVLQIEEMTGGESRSELLIYLPKSKALFVGDLVFSGVHADIKEGHSREWLANLQAVTVKFPEIGTVYPGHGNPGPTSLISAQVDYLTHFRNLISSRMNLKHPAVPFDGLAYQYVQETMIKAYGYVNNLPIGLSSNALISELLKEAGYQPEEDEE